MNGSREGEAITRPSRAGDKRSRQPESRVRKIWPSFIRMPWDIWVDEVVDGEKGAGADIDVTVLAKHSMNVQRLGIEAAFDLAVAEGEIDGEMQKWVTNKAFGELAAFELFSNSAREDGSRRFPKGGGPRGSPGRSSALTRGAVTEMPLLQQLHGSSSSSLMPERQLLSTSLSLIHI